MSDSRNRGSGRVYSPPGVSRHRKQLKMEREQREREMMFLQFHHLQQLRMMMRCRQFDERKRQQKQRLIQQQVQLQEHRMALRQKIRVQATAVAVAEKENWSEAVESTFSGNSSLIRTNIDRLVETVTPCVPTRFLPEPRRNGQEAHEAGLIQFYNLEDLWESYKEWSAYGAGVELTLNGNENVMQYYVPSLSIIQLYVDPAAPRKSGIDMISQRMSQMSMPSSSSTGESSQSSGKLIFEYKEHEQPHQRKPLFDKISALATGYADLKKYRSCELLPSSWISVAWYPIYRIPTGPSLKILDASFLTFHHLSTPPTSGRSVVGASPSSKMTLPVFGLASYKLISSNLPLMDSEQRLSNSLFKSAENWIERLGVYHPDYNFFLRNGKSPETNPDQSEKS